MSKKIIDMDLTKEILSNYNNGLYDNIEPVKVKTIPGFDDSRIIERAGMESWSVEYDKLCKNLREVNPSLLTERFGKLYGSMGKRDDKKIVTFTRDELRQIGIQLYPYVSYGILNGGSATSYADSKKNAALNSELMKLYKSLFEKTSKKAVGKAKGITPAFRNTDGSSGPDFIELKMRALLVENLGYRLNVNNKNEIFRGDAETKNKKALYPMFQMTSVYNDEEIKARIQEYQNGPLLKGLLDITDIDMSDILTGIQPMLAAYTHSRVGRPKQIFTNAFGRNGEMLPVPGGHGQNFQIMSRIYRYMYEELDKKFIYLGNVDNIGNMPDPVSIAITAISGVQASFEFAFRTPVDTKGGILITDQRGRLNCADIGPAVSREEVDSQEAGGKKILYNCATGLFNLEHLTKNLDKIISGLPMRFTDQEKDAGAYSQAEQVTWEIIGLLDDILILGVNKYDRYLAAKLLLESFMTSGIMIDSEKYPSHPDPSLDFKKTAEELYRGLQRNLDTTYFMDMKNGKWQPLEPDRVMEKIKNA